MSTKRLTSGPWLTVPEEPYAGTVWRVRYRKVGSDCIYECRYESKAKAVEMLSGLTDLADDGVIVLGMERRRIVDTGWRTAD